MMLKSEPVVKLGPVLQMGHFQVTEPYVKQRPSVMEEVARQHARGERSRDTFVNMSKKNDVGDHPKDLKRGE